MRRRFAILIFACLFSLLPLAGCNSNGETRDGLVEPRMPLTAPSVPVE